jgi:hypothetical protein
LQTFHDRAKQTDDIGRAVIEGLRTGSFGTEGQGPLHLRPFFTARKIGGRVRLIVSSVAPGNNHFLRHTGCRGIHLRVNMGRVSKRRLSAAAFLRLRPWLVNIEVPRLQAAYLSIVEGKPQRDIAEEYQWSQQAVSDAVAVVWKRLERAIEAGFNPADNSPQDTASADPTQYPVPEGWVTAIVVAPPELLDKFRAEIAAYKLELPESPQQVQKPTRRKTT